jgi:hypothetical protein
MTTNDIIKLLESIATPVGVPLIVSLLAIFFSDRIKFGVERLRENTVHRRKLVASWQSMLSKELENNKGWDIYKSKEYISLRPYLRENALETLEPFKDSKRSIGTGSGYKDGVAGNIRLLIISNEITRIQKKWKIY